LKRGRLERRIAHAQAGRELTAFGQLTLPLRHRLLLLLLNTLLHHLLPRHFFLLLRNATRDGALLVTHYVHLRIVALTVATPVAAAKHR
jgi:hypothetical protein